MNVFSGRVQMRNGKLRRLVLAYTIALCWKLQHTQYGVIVISSQEMIDCPIVPKSGR